MQAAAPSCCRCIWANASLSCRMWAPCLSIAVLTSFGPMGVPSVVSSNWRGSGYRGRRFNWFRKGGRFRCSNLVDGTTYVVVIEGVSDLLDRRQAELFDQGLGGCFCFLPL